MGSLQYAGAVASTDSDLATKRTIDAAIAATSPNQLSVQGDIQAAITDRVKKEYVDLQDARYAPASEYSTKDLNRNVAKATANTPNNVATLPLSTSRFTLVGSGYTMGPYGWQSMDAPTSTGGVVTVATLSTDAIPKDKKFWPIAFGQVLMTSADTGGLPVVEIKSGGGLLLATGRGRTMFTGGQGITAMPVAGGDWPASNGGPLVVTMTLSDLNGRPFTAKDGSVIAIGGAVYILVAS